MDQNPKSNTHPITGVIAVSATVLLFFITNHFFQTDIIQRAYRMKPTMPPETSYREPMRILTTRQISHDLQINNTSLVMVGSIFVTIVLIGITAYIATGRKRTILIPITLALIVGYFNLISIREARQEVADEVNVQSIVPWAKARYGVSIKPDQAEQLVDNHATYVGTTLYSFSLPDEDQDLKEELQTRRILVINDERFGQHEAPIKH